MLRLFGYLVICIGLVFGAPETSTTNGYVVTIDNHILKSVVKTSNAPDNLNLSSRQLDDIEWNAFRGLNNLKTLNLDNNNLRSFNEMALVPLRSLENLSLVNNPLGPITYQFLTLNNLKIINVTGSESVSLSGSRFRRGRQRADILGYQGIEKISRPLNEIERKGFLSVLCIKENGIVRSLERVTSPVNLTEDAIQNCSKAQLVETLLNDLDLENLGIAGFEANWYRLGSVDFIKRRLIFLKLSNNNITDLRNMMQNDLPSTLYLRNNPIERVERGIINNEAVTVLDISNCAISEIEDNAFVDTSLTSLFLSHNKLTSLNFMATLPTSLTKLDLASNKFVQLIPEAFRRFTNLTILNLDGNDLTSLAEGVFDGLENLETLSLDHNQITDITAESLRGLSSNLLDLDLGWNEIAKLKRGTFINKPRRGLILRRNKITEIEDGTFNLPNLTYLDLSSNLLTTLRNETFLGIKRLDRLFLTLNNITTFETGVLSIMDPNGIVCRDDIPLTPFCRAQLAKA